jgi:hypothetical protein
LLLFFVHRFVSVLSAQNEYVNHSSHPPHDGGENGAGDDDPFDDSIFFAPAEHTESIKQRKERKRQERLQRRTEREEQQQKATPAPGSKASSSSSRGGGGDNYRRSSRAAPGSGSFESSETDDPALPDPAQLESRQGTPPALSGASHHPRPPKSRRSHNSDPYHSSTRFRDDGTHGYRDGPAANGAAAGLLPNLGDYGYRECGEDVWYYAKWWLFCIPDAVRSMTERR